jgi:hypothetical protein
MSGDVRGCQQNGDCKAQKHGMLYELHGLGGLERLAHARAVSPDKAGRGGTRSTRKNVSALLASVSKARVSKYFASH